MKAEFRTPIIIKKSQVKLNHQCKLLLMGSCFTNHIGERLAQLKFNTLSKPFGISYHPLAIHQQLSFQINSTVNLHENNGVFFSYDSHSSQNALSKESYTNSFRKNIEQLIAFVTKCDTLIITYGTAWVYELIENGKIVNNCHQQPAAKFSKRLLSVDEIVNSWKQTADLLYYHFGPKKIIFTISPVRHLKDGFHENQLSKATLQLAIDAICKLDTSCTYFPAYEIMMDDLRDYRFYKDDFLHPNQLAIDYIWNCFGQTFFDEKTIVLNQQIRKLMTAFNHKAFQPKSRKHQKFLKQLVQKFQTIQKETSIDFKDEIESVIDQIVD